MPGTAVLDLRERWPFEVRVFEARTTSFHPKCYLFRDADGSATAFVGSSNLSRSALGSGVEWNYRSREREGVAEVQSSFELLFHHPATRPLTPEWIAAYRRRRRPALVGGRAMPIESESVEPPPEPHAIQREALAALADTRAQGNQAGLVVMATGVGKTWLAAFDSARFERVLFVAHREEILGQAQRTFRRLRPQATMGFYSGTAKDRDADLLFASIQTLGRLPHLERFARDRFDYIVVDEFHHAAASTYRKLIAYFEPRFLLGLTATPDRTDGADLLALCGENLVYRCDVAQGIREGLLCPFHYFGVPDDVDYRNIPWRNNRFDEEALTSALATRARAQNALEQLRRLGGKRTVAFCVSVRHARFMKDYLQEQGLRAAAVHSGLDSDARTTSLERLGAGELDVVCTVDMFNEGVDLPELDTVMMLRPTESRILWVQQFGRGLRKADGKPHLKVIDYIGNHRTFLLKPQTLFDLPAGDESLSYALELLSDGPLVGPLEQGTVRLPPGCEVTYDLRAITLLRALLQRPSGQDALRVFYEEFRERLGVRPRAVEAMHAGYDPRAARKRYGSWLGFVRSMGDLGDFGAVAELEVLPVRTAGPLLALEAMAGESSLALAEVRSRMGHAARRSARLKADLGEDAAPWATLSRFLRVSGGRLEWRVPVAPALVEELVEWRLAEYLRGGEAVADGAWRLPVGASGQQAVLGPLDRSSGAALPHGETLVRVDGQVWTFRFDEAAVPFATAPGSDKNGLPPLLRQWFGPDAGMAGTRHQVRLEETPEGLSLSPIAPRVRDAGGKLWERYAREEIPLLFDMPFSQAIWNVGIVVREHRIFLLVTLDKQKIHAEQFAYQDRFLSDRLFQWQSQNQTTRASGRGQMLRDPRSEVHLFVRPEKKGRLQASSYLYCGQLDFRSWEGDSPITVRWELREAVPARLWGLLEVPG